MAWLKLSLPLEEEFEVEQQTRQIQEHEDIEDLRDMASTCFRNLYYQQELTSQLLRQCAELEYENAKLAKKPLPPRQYMEWAKSLWPHDPPTEEENDLGEYQGGLK